jgi:hypothetical protein
MYMCVHHVDEKDLITRVKMYMCTLSLTTISFVRPLSPLLLLNSLDTAKLN